MTYWDGTRWVPEPRTASSSARRRPRFVGALTEALLITSLTFGLVASSTLAGRPSSTTACVVDGHLVTAFDLPTDEILNFMVSDARGKRGWVLGFTDTGSWTEVVPERYGATTYEFASKTYGRNGAKYRVFASCAV